MLYFNIHFLSFLSFISFKWSYILPRILCWIYHYFTCMEAKVWRNTPHPQQRQPTPHSSIHYLTQPISTFIQKLFIHRNRKFTSYCYIVSYEASHCLNSWVDFSASFSVSGLINMGFDCWHRSNRFINLLLGEISPSIKCIYAHINQSGLRQKTLQWCSEINRCHFTYLATPPNCSL